MWKWTCPKNHRPGLGDVIYESHSKEKALEMIHGHETTSWEPLGITPCDAVHEVIDDGEPCNYPNCRFLYTREAVVSPWLTELRYYDSTGKLVEIRRIYSPRPGGINNSMTRGKSRGPVVPDDSSL